LVSPDIEEVMIGADWLEQHPCVWDFGGKKLFIDGRPAVMVTRNKKLRCRRLYSEAEVVIPPRQEVEVTVRSTLCSLQKSNTQDMVEAKEIKPRVYVGRALLAPEHRGQKVNVVNTTEAPTVLVWYMVGQPLTSQSGILYGGTQRTANHVGTVRFNTSSRSEAW